MDESPALRRKAPSDALDKRGATKLHKLARRGCIVSVKRLINQGACVNSLDYKQRTPLLYAVHGGHINVVRVLINANASVNAKDKYGQTALVVSAEKGYSEIVKLLMNSGADLGAANRRGFTALHHSAYNGHIQSAGILLKNNSPLEAVDLLEGTPLHAGACCDQAEVVKMLLEAGACVNAVDSYGQTPLHKCAMLGHTTTLKVLVKWNASLDIHDKFGLNPLQTAIKYGHQDIIKYLQSGCSCRSFIQKPDNNNIAQQLTGQDITEASSAFISQRESLPAEPSLTAPSLIVSADSTAETSYSHCAKIVSSALAIPIKERVTQLLTQICSNPDIHGSMGEVCNPNRRPVNVNVVINCNVHTEKMVVNNQYNIKTEHVRVKEVGNLALGNSSIFCVTADNNSANGDGHQEDDHSVFCCDAHESSGGICSQTRQ